MGRRTHTTSVRCAESDCTKGTFYESSNLRERADLEKRLRETPWRCTRHNRPEEVLRPDHTAIQHVLVATRVKASTGPYRDSAPRYLDGLYWIPEGEETGSGFTYGPGFKAHAGDFPEGTRLVVTAYVETPEQQVITAGIDAGEMPR